MTEKNNRLPPQFRDGGFQVRANSFDEADRTVEIVLATEAPVRRYDWRDGCYYDEVLVVTPGAIRLDRLNRGAPLLDSHSSYSLSNVLGSVVDNSARVEGKVVVAKVRLSRAPDVASEVQKIIDGDVRNISVGYRIHKVEKTEGDDGDVALWRIVDWEPYEVSAVPIPADAGAQVRSEKLTDAMNEVEFIGGHPKGFDAAVARMRMRAAAIARRIGV